MDNDRLESLWGVTRRLDLIELRLPFFEHLNLSHLAEKVGNSGDPAPTDLNRHIGFVPGNMVYDKISCSAIRIYTSEMLPDGRLLEALHEHEVDADYNKVDQ